MTTVTKEYKKDTSPIKPSNIGFRIVGAMMARPEDSYENGEQTDALWEHCDFPRKAIFTDAPAMFCAVWDNLTAESVKPANIGTIDNTIYCDTKAGETRIVDAKNARGVHRLIFDRLETEDGQVPTPEQRAQWEKGEFTLYTGRYEIEFEALLLGLDESDLATVCGTNNW